ncbi:MAG TPA: HAMP domain-containing sensor histidine kinase, partial [Thermoanaerobaculia bacterium]
SIIGWCGLLSDEKLRDTLLDEGLASIAQAARVQSQLVEDLLDVSRIMAGRLEPRLAEVNPADIVEDAIASVAPSARAKGITITTFVEGQPQTLQADATRLEQVVWNLLSNAIRFTPANGMISITLRFSGSHLEIRVTDNGEGIGPDLLPYIFDRFRQGQATGTRKGGLGLGLSIVKSLVELHGGTVRAESGGVGAGATFIVELPLRVVGKPKEAARAAELRLSI